MRAACCMLCVTMTMVNSFFKSKIKSSMRAVAMGSSALAGSSIKITSGLMAMARAMHNRCCWPPDKPSALECSRSFTSSHNAEARRHSSMRESKSGFDFTPCRRRP